MTTATALNLFIPITKVDAAQRLVYGLATAEKVDRSGEVCDYESTKPFYEKWSGDIAKTTDGKSLGNVRAMHGKVAAGKVTAINFNDSDKQIEICAKVVDDNEWKKVEEGVYTGFSQGGAYVKRWKDGDVQKYTADPSEVSLVDLPCLDIATFSIIKADGTTEMRKFVTAPAPATTEPTNDQIVAKATDLAKAAGKGTFVDFIVEARAELTKAASAAEKPAGESAPELTADVGKAADAPSAAVAVTAVPVEKSAALAPGEEPWEQVWLSKRDGSTHKTKAELRKHHADMDAAAQTATAAAPIQSTLDALNAKLGIGKAADAKPGKDDKDADATAAGDDQGKSEVTGKKKGKAKKDLSAQDLQKSLYTVGRFASILSDLHYLQQDTAWEREYEGDASTVPDQIKAAIATLSQALRDMAVEETSELFDPENANDALLISVMELSAGMPKDHMDALIKMATADTTLEKCRDNLAKAGARNSQADQKRIQAAHDAIVAAGASCETEKAAGGDLAKAADELSKATARGDALQKALDGIQPQLDAIGKAVEHLLSQPVAHPLTRLVSKGQDNGGGAEADAQAALAKMTPDEVALLVIKAAQQNGQPLLSRGK
ncbi:hypothetical protein [Bradyrhizobium sp. RT10b]|uniref:hypothetical protein n=1 Tax=Bradyrhizobium sp. RT10b TaxID=3156331 RepID=UPI00339542B1